MRELVDELIELIRGEEKVLEDFLDCLSRQKESIVRNDLERFDATVQEEESLIERVRNLEEGRMKVVKRIAHTAGGQADDLTLTRLIELNLGENSEELMVLKRTLASLVDRVRRAIKVNQYLLKRSLSYIQKNVDWFIDEDNLNVIYSPRGRERMGDAGRILVDKKL
ncbi:MAG: flagellar protein FlgN [Calditrichota bacterium]